MNNLRGRSRHIPARVVRELVKESRGKCCLCRRITPIEFSELTHTILEKHHIVHFSDGGCHTVENLVLLDAECHRLVHMAGRPPIDDDELRNAKETWRRLQTIADLLMEKFNSSFSRQSCLDFRFRFETYALDFALKADLHMTFGSLAEAIKVGIVLPIAHFDEAPHISEATLVGLRTETRRYAFDPGQQIIECLREIRASPLRLCGEFKVRADYG